MKTLDITFRAEKADGKDETITLTQKDSTSLWMNVGGTSYKLYLNGLLLHMFMFEMRRRQMMEIEDGDTSQNEV